MFADVSHAWVLSLITAGAGLGGVGLGGLMTAWAQKKERKNARIREQLEHFYSPMLGMRAEIRAKSRVRREISIAAGASWSRKFEGSRNPETSERISKSDGPRYDKIIDYDNQQSEEV